MVARTLPNDPKHKANGMRKPVQCHYLYTRRDKLLPRALSKCKSSPLFPSTAVVIRSRKLIIRKKINYMEQMQEFKNNSSHGIGNKQYARKSHLLLTLIVVYFLLTFFSSENWLSSYSFMQKECKFLKIHHELYEEVTAIQMLPLVLKSVSL